MNNGGEKVDTLTPERKATSVTPGNLFKQSEEKTGENNLNNQDSYAPQEKLRSPVQQASFSGRWDSAQTASVPSETKDSRGIQGRSRSKTRKSRKQKYQSSSSSSSSLACHQAIFLNQKHLPVPAHHIEKERNVRNQRKRKVKRTKQRDQKAKRNIKNLIALDLK